MIKVIEINFKLLLNSSLTFWNKSNNNKIILYGKKIYKKVVKNIKFKMRFAQFLIKNYSFFTNLYNTYDS